MLDAILKASLYLATICLIGGVVFGYFIDPRSILMSKNNLLLTSILGASAAIGASFADSFFKLYSLLGPFGVSSFLDFMLSTQQGRMALLRALMLLVLIGLLILKRDALWVKISVLGLSLGILISFSLVSHGASMAGRPLFLTDLIHFLAAGIWAGPLAYLAFSRFHADKARAFTLALKRLSRLGLISLIGLFVTGLLMSFSFMTEPSSFLGSSYAQSLYLKLLLVLIIVAVATYNRFYLLPLMSKAELIPHHALAFRCPLRLEAILLGLVFLSTGLLTTRAMPHNPGDSFNAFSNFIKFIQTYWR